MPHPTTGTASTRGRVTASVPRTCPVMRQQTVLRDYWVGPTLQVWGKQVELCVSTFLLLSAMTLARGLLYGGLAGVGHLAHLAGYQRPHVGLWVDPSHRTEPPSFNMVNDGWATLFLHGWSDEGEEQGEGTAGSEEQLGWRTVPSRADSWLIGCVW